WRAGGLLRRRGFQRVIYLKGHMHGWRRAGLREQKAEREGIKEEGLQRSKGNHVSIGCAAPHGPVAGARIGRGDARGIGARGQDQQQRQNESAVAQESRGGPRTDIPPDRPSSVSADHPRRRLQCAAVVAKAYRLVIVMTNSVPCTGTMVDVTPRPMLIF